MSELRYVNTQKLGEFEYDTDLFYLADKFKSPYLKWIGGSNPVVLPKGLISTARMFEGYHSVKFDFSRIDTSEIQSMSYMFDNCSLTEYDFSTFETDNITEAWGMFARNNFCFCNKIELDLGLATVDYLFKGSCGTQKLILDDLIIEKCSSFSSMFQGFSSLTELNLAVQNEVIADYTDRMFADCKKLTKLCLPKFKNELLDMSNMFNNCTNLKVLDLSCITIEETCLYQDIFYNCISLKSLVLPNNFQYPQLDSFINCGRLCYLENLDIKTEYITMFNRLYNYTKIKEV